MASFGHEITRGRLLRWIEFAALVPATVLLAPLMFAGMAGMLFAMHGVWVGTGAYQQKAVALGVMLRLFAQLVVGLGSLALLWILSVGGVGTIRHSVPWRASSIVLVVLGAADALYFILSDRGVRREMASSAWSMFMWTAVLGLPVLVGIRYVYLLLRPAQRDSPGGG